MINKRISLALVITFLMQIFPNIFVMVQANEGIFPEEMIYADDFSNTKIDERIMTVGGDIVIKDGKLNFTKTESKDATIMNIYVDTQKTSIKGLFGIEFTMERTSKKEILQRFRSTNSDIVALNWKPDGTIEIEYRDGELGASTLTAEKYSEKVNVKALIDTEQSTFSIWLDDKMILEDKSNRSSLSKDFSYLEFYLDDTNYNTLKVDNLKIYNANPPSSKTTKYDAERLTEDSLLIQTTKMGNIVVADLALPSKGYFGSNITWQSSNKDVIDSKGSVKRPILNDENVILIATFDKNGVKQDKTFNFVVAKALKDDVAKAQADMEMVNYENIANQDKNSIITSLNLPCVGINGTSINWSSNNVATITNSGRVIRPTNDKPAQTATLTADFGNGITKQFTFKVLPDEKFVDPQYMSDEEFFGKWVEGIDGHWEMEGKLDYSNEDLTRVKMVVKAGYYDAAKNELRKYMQNRKVVSPYDTPKRDALWSDIATSDFIATQNEKYYQAIRTLTSLEYQEVAIDVKVGSIAKGGSTTFAVVAMHNENSVALIASKQNSNSNLKPKLELIVNGKPRVYEVEADATVRAGAYKDKNYGREQDLKAKMFGEFLSDETYKALMRFNLTDLIDSDEVTAAKLIINTKVSPGYAGTKDIVVLLEAANIWEEDTVNFNALMGYVYNFDGITGGNTWDPIPGADYTLNNQASRFLESQTIAEEFKSTKDEKYAYSLITQMMDFINDKEMYITYGIAGAWPPGVPLRGGYPGTLHAGFRLTTWNKSLESLINSKYMSGEVLTAILKSVWSTTDNLMLTRTGNNARQADLNAVIRSSLNYPEFKDSEKWLDFGCRGMEEYLYYNNFADGSYKEKTGGYNILVYRKFIAYKQLMESLGKKVSPSYDDMMKKSALYNSLLIAPNGSKLQFGDEGAGKSTAQKFPSIVEWYGDKELEYIDSFGEKGTQPEWTSYQFPDSTYTMMRSDWSKDALFAFTQVRGAGPHGHKDDAGLIVMAYDRMLLNDAGIFTYTLDDPYRVWAESTRAHNTVEINDETQPGVGVPVGKVNDWITTNNYDFSSQNTYAYNDYGDHQRTITFVKPNFWIVSDLMTPQDKTKENSYKQIWHMLPSAGLTTDNQQKTINSNYDTGANIILATPDKDITLNEYDGWYDYNYQQLAPAKYACYEIKDSKGKAAYDTILLPYNDEAQIDVERIDLGVDKTVATSMKFKTVIDSAESQNYFLLDYEHNSENTRKFDKYVTNNKLSFVREDKNGNWKEIILAGGKTISYADGSELVALASGLSDVSFEIKDNSIEVSTSVKNPDFSNIVIVTNDDIKKVIFNDTELLFTKDGNKITINANTVVGTSADQNTDRDFEIPTTTVYPFYTQFTDTQGNWADKDIKYLLSRNVLKIDPRIGTFRPDEDITRAEFLSMIVRSIDEESFNSLWKLNVYKNSFKDVKARDWHANFIQIALDKNLISQDEYFRPNDKITREEMCKILVKANGILKGKQIPPESFEIKYSDLSQISDWAVQYVTVATYAKLINGTTSATFNPLDNLTRAEAAAAICRMLKY